jgi:hypothetical protein
MEKKLVDTMNYSITSSETLEFNKTGLRNLLRENNAEILFTKKDGTKRLMKCTLRESEIVQYEKKTERAVKDNDSVLAVWDLEASAWRTVNINTIETVSTY